MGGVDLRLARVGIEIQGRINWYNSSQGFKVKATGTKYANPEQNECTVTITNLSRATRDFLVTEASPFNSNPTPKRLILEVGRVSTGLTRIFIGDITSAEPSVPPDIELEIVAKTANASKGKLAAKSAGAQSKLSAIAKSIADDIGVSLDFQAQDKNIGNYSHSGPELKQVELLQQAGGVSAYIDDGKLVVKDAKMPLTGRIRILNKNTGMVGVPKPTEKGLKVTFLIDADTVLGGALRLQSQINPAANGDYVITQLSFDVATHDSPFWYTALATRV
jgi:hypothetical protein